MESRTSTNTVILFALSSIWASVVATSTEVAGILDVGDFSIDVKYGALVLGKLFDSCTLYIAWVTIVQRAGNAMTQIKYVVGMDKSTLWWSFLAIILIHIQALIVTEAKHDVRESDNFPRTYAPYFTADWQTDDDRA